VLTAQLLGTLGYGDVAYQLTGSISQTPWPASMKDVRSYGFTNPITGTISIVSGLNFVEQTSILFHENYHRTRQSRLLNTYLGVRGHWLKNRTCESILEEDAYKAELPFLKRWLSMAKDSTTIDFINLRMTFVNQQILALQNAAAKEYQEHWQRFEDFDGPYPHPLPSSRPSYDGP
jgi:hypothetical protein